MKTEMKADMRTDVKTELKGAKPAINGGKPCGND